jgi:hypothetical protein
MRAEKQILRFAKDDNLRSGWVEAGTVEVVGDVEGAGGGVAEAGRDLGFLEAEADAGELDVGERAAGCGGWGCRSSACGEG